MRSHWNKQLALELVNFSSQNPASQEHSVLDTLGWLVILIIKFSLQAAGAQSCKGALGDQSHPTAEVRELRY